MSAPSIKKNYLYNLFYEILVLITPLVTAPYVARVLGSEGVGTQSYTNSIVTYFTLIGSLGVASYGQQEIARRRNDKKDVSTFFWELVIFRLTTMGIATIVYIGMIFLNHSYRAIYVALIMQIAASSIDIAWFFNGLEKFKVIVFRNTVIKFVAIASLFIFIKDSNDLLLYIALLASFGLIGNISMWFCVKSELVKVNFKDLKIFRHFNNTIVYFIPTIATSVYTYLDKTMIGMYSNGKAENGYYEQATKIINMAKTVIISLNTVMASRMALLFSQKKYDEIHDKIEKSISYILFMGIPISFGIAGIADDFVPVFFGKGYDKVVPLLYIFSPIVVIIGLSNCIGRQYLTPSGQRARSNRAIVLGAVVNLVLNLLLIPKYHSIGASISSIIAETVILGWYLIMGKDFVSIKLLIREGYKRLIASIIMFIYLYEVGKIWHATLLHVFLQIISGIAIYVLMMFIIRDKMFFAVLKKGREKIQGLRRK